MKKITIIIIILLLISNNTLYAYAESAPGTITVSGGSIESGGVEGNSGILKGTALAVVMATLASVGISVKLTAEDYAKGNTAINFVQDKFEEWEANANRGWDAYEALNTTKVGANGELYVDQTATSIIQQFLNWLDAEHYIATESGSNVGVDGTFFGNTWNGPSGFSYVLSDGLAGNIAAISWGENRYVIFAFASVPFQFSRLNNNGGRTIDCRQVGDWYVASTYRFEESSIPGLFNISTLGYNYIYNKDWACIDPYINSLSSQPDTNIAQTGFYGETADIPQLIDESGNGKILTVQPGLIGQVQDAYTGSNNATIGVQDYLDALKDLYGQQAIPQEITDLPDITIPGEDAITGTKEEVAVIDRDLVLAPDITVPADPGAITWPEVPEVAVPVADPSTPADSEISIPAMSVDLTKIFPFCIPWDLYNLLSKFNADPVTPSVTINWGNILGSIGVNFTTTLDLHDYDDVAAILRNMETVAFVIGLAVATRQIFTHS